MNDDPSLDSILSGASETAPEPSRIVDEPEGIITELAEGKPSAIELEPGESRDEPNGKIPFGKIKEAEREKVAKRYTEQVADFERKLEQQNAQWEQRFTQIIGAMRQPAPQEQPSKPEIWDDPDAYIQNGTRQVVEPLQQQMQMLQRNYAELKYKPEIVAEAEKAFDEARLSGRMDPDVHRRINSSPNPWAAAVEWHQQSTALAQIGPDPAAYEQRIRAEERAAFLAEIQKSGRIPDAASFNEAQPGAMPSNFADARNAGGRLSGPGDQGDPSIGDILASKQRGAIFK